MNEETKVENEEAEVENEEAEVENEETKVEESEKTPVSSSRKASSGRLLVLLLFLVAIGAGCIYEFSVARPGFQKAWEQVRQVDESASSSEYTSDQIQVMMGREPINIDDKIHEDCVVHSYRWRSGLLIKNHDIHVVFTKLKPAIEEQRPDLKGKLFYYSASAGQPLDLESNFPTEKQTIVVNLNAPRIGLGGGPPRGGGRPARQGAEDKKGSDDKKDAGDSAEETTNDGDEDSADKEGSAKKEASESPDAAAEEKAEGETADATKEKEATDDKSGDEKSGDEKSGESGEEKSGDEKSGESGEEKSGEEKSDG